MTSDDIHNDTTKPPDLNNPYIDLHTVSLVIVEVTKTHFMCFCIAVFHTRILPGHANDSAKRVCNTYFISHCHQPIAAQHFLLNIYEAKMDA